MGYPDLSQQCRGHHSNRGPYHTAHPDPRRYRTSIIHAVLAVLLVQRTIMQRITSLQGLWRETPISAGESKLARIQTPMKLQGLYIISRVNLWISFPLRAEPVYP